MIPHNHNNSKHFMELYEKVTNNGQEILSLKKFIDIAFNSKKFSDTVINNNIDTFRRNLKERHGYSIDEDLLLSKIC